MDRNGGVSGERTRALDGTDGRSVERPVIEQETQPAESSPDPLPISIWIGFTKEQRDTIETGRFIGNNGWDRNGQTDEVMPRLLKLSLAGTKEAMAAVGHSRNELHQLDRWGSK